MALLSSTKSTAKLYNKYRWWVFRYSAVLIDFHSRRHRGQVIRRRFFLSVARRRRCVIITSYIRNMSLRCVHRHDVDEMRCSIHSGKQKEKPSDTLIELCNFFSFFFLYRRASGECVFLFYGPGVLVYTWGGFVRSLFSL